MSEHTPRVSYHNLKWAIAERDERIAMIGRLLAGHKAQMKAQKEMIDQLCANAAEYRERIARMTAALTKIADGDSKTNWRDIAVSALLAERSDDRG